MISNKPNGGFLSGASPVVAGSLFGLAGKTLRPTGWQGAGGALAGPEGAPSFVLTLPPKTIDALGTKVAAVVSKIASLDMKALMQSKESGASLAALAESMMQTDQLEALALAKKDIPQAVFDKLPGLEDCLTLVVNALYADVYYKQGMVAKNSLNSGILARIAAVRSKIIGMKSVQKQQAEEHLNLLRKEALKILNPNWSKSLARKTISINPEAFKSIALVLNDPLAENVWQSKWKNTTGSVNVPEFARLLHEIYGTGEDWPSHKADKVVFGAGLSYPKPKTEGFRFPKGLPELRKAPWVYSVMDSLESFYVPRISGETADILRKAYASTGIPENFQMVTDVAGTEFSISIPSVGTLLNEYADAEVVLLDIINKMNYLEMALNPYTLESRVEDEAFFSVNLGMKFPVASLEQMVKLGKGTGVQSDIVWL